MGTKRCEMSSLAEWNVPSAESIWLLRMEASKKTKLIK